MSKSKSSKSHKVRNDFYRLFACACVAVNTGDLKPLRKCLASGINPDSPERDNFGRTLLFRHELPSSVAKVLLDAKANARAWDANGFTPLHNANIEVARLLLARGADIEAREHQFLGTPLLTQAAMGRADMVEFLLDHGANVDAQTNQGGTALSTAQTAGHTDVCDVIIAHVAAKRQRALDVVAATAQPGYVRAPTESSQAQRRM
ncbi:MAG: ankyrin repeat domain-containing protein [Xanthomonadales bacterium]|nr:ankyrin repeat domain-containing protein [Xanthomonadales bacterium]